MTSTIDQDAPAPGSNPGAPPPVVGLDRLQVLLSAAMGTVLVSYALLVPLVAAVLLTGGAADGLDGVFAAAIPVWLAAHLIPLTLEGQSLSVLPLLPTALVLLVTAAGARWAVGRLGADSSGLRLGADSSGLRLGARFRADAGAVLAAVAGAHAAVAVLGSALLPRAAEIDAAPWAAMVGGGAIAGIGASIGVVRRCGVPGDLLEPVPHWVWTGLRAARLAVLTVLLAGAIALTVALLLGAPAVARAYGELAPGFWSGLGVTLLVLAYLPNAVVAGAAWVLGPGVAVGTGTASMFATAPVPASSSFPLLAALPSATPPAWTLVALVAPLAAGVLAGRECRRSAPAEGRVPAAAVAIIVTVAVIGLLAAVAGGRLAAGAFDPVTVPVGLTMAAVLLLVGGPALLVAGIARRGEPDEAEWVDDAGDTAGGSGDDVGAPDAAQDEPARPRTVAELVALRERQAAEAAARSADADESAAGAPEADAGGAEADDESGADAEVADAPEDGESSDAEPAAGQTAAPEPGPPAADEEADVVEPFADRGNVVSFERRRRRT